MAVSINNVYQKVLAIANKEQRGYITPQEFNLFANQAQMDIFEQYFYDKNQYNRLPKDNTPYADLDHLLEEKISIFKKRQQPVTIINQFGDGTLPNDVYRLDNLTRLSLTGVSGSTANIIEEVTEDEFMLMDRTPLAKATIERPVYVRTSATGVKIKPHSVTPSASAAVYFTQNGDTDGTTTISVDAGGNLDFIEAGQTITGTDIPAGTTVVSISGSGPNNLEISQAATGSSPDVTLTFASDDVKCNYIRKPATVKWTYTVIVGKALYNASATDLQNFELHESEENNLVIKILQLAGISMKDYNVTQVASQKESSDIQQEKQ
jgi:hypothetical protein